MGSSVVFLCAHILWAGELDIPSQGLFLQSSNPAGITRCLWQLVWLSPWWFLLSWWHFQPCHCSGDSQVNLWWLQTCRWLQTPWNLENWMACCRWLAHFRLRGLKTAYEVFWLFSLRSCFLIYPVRSNSNGSQPHRDNLCHRGWKRLCQSFAKVDQRLHDRWEAPMLGLTDKSEHVTLRKVVI